MTDVSSISNAIISGNFTNEQLNIISESIRFARAQLAHKAKSSITIGTKVKFTSSTRGTIVGMVKKINRKFIIVNEAGTAFTTWRVPANMLEVV